MRVDRKRWCAKWTEIQTHGFSRKRARCAVWSPFYIRRLFSTGLWHPVVVWSLTKCFVGTCFDVQGVRWTARHRNPFGRNYVRFELKYKSFPYLNKHPDLLVFLLRTWRNVIEDVFSFAGTFKPPRFARQSFPNRHAALNPSLPFLTYLVLHRPSSEDSCLLQYDRCGNLKSRTPLYSFPSFLPSLLLSYQDPNHNLNFHYLHKALVYAGKWDYLNTAHTFSTV